MFKDYYKLLEISQNATEAEIKKAFREQAIKWHPDRNKGTDTTLRMQEINEAYLILKDFEARHRYDIEYNKFRQYQESKSRTDNEKSNKKEPYNQQYNSKKQYEYSDYKVEDDLLSKWMANAKKQAVDISKQTIKNFKGVTEVAANGCLKGVFSAIGVIVIWLAIIFMFKACNN